jgi:hypothetical protein
VCSRRRTRLATSLDETNIMSNARASRTRSFGTPSNYGASAEHLSNRGVSAVETPYSVTFHEANAGLRAVEAFLQALLCPLEVALDADDLVESCERLRSAANSSHGSEAPFSGELFGAMGELFRRFAPSSTFASRRQKPTPWGRVIVNDTAIILVRKESKAVGGYEYAAGLAREATLRPESGSILLDDGARLDHAAVVYRKPAGGNDKDFVVWRALAVVDFKVGDIDCKPAKKAGGTAVDPDSLALSHAVNGPLAQVIMYTFALAVPGSAALGELPESVPFAVVGCRTDPAQSIEFGWVHGNVVTPKACGELYSFSVDAYGPLRPTNDFSDGSSESNAAAYLHVMTKGLEGAVRWLERLKEETPADGLAPSKLPAPHHVSGRDLRFGRSVRWGLGATVSGSADITEIKDATLLGTPVLEYRTEDHFRIHQGELFRARVNLDDLRSKLGRQHRVFWCPDAYPSKDPAPVLIKVSSKACFHLLIPSHGAYLYSLPENADPWERVVRGVLSQSLHGVYVTPDRCGVVQILPDLLRLKYSPLPHGNDLDAAGWVALWRAFASLVTGVLVPLARAGIVHPDVRTGYDATSNLLYNAADGSMRLIDLDSLCTYERLLDLPRVADLKYLSARGLPGTLASAMGFVLGQVVCAAEVWIGRTLHNEVKANATFLGALRSATDGPSHPFGFRADAFDEDGTFQATVDDALIVTVLERYQEKFDA